jgi:DNA adenine methylase
MRIANSSTELRPLLKWAGGKRQVLPAIRPIIPPSFKRYLEPFLGGGAVFFDLLPKRVIINDLNAELMSMYRVVRDNPSELIGLLSSMANTSNSYYEIRSWDRNPDYLESFSSIERAARTIYLNRTGYNGLYRVNARNQYNVPFGKYRNPKVCDSELILMMSNYLSSRNIKITSEDFRQNISRASEGDFLYVDPPYAPLDNANSTFTNYTAGGFSQQDLVDLKDSLDVASKKGACWILSNVKSRTTSRMFTSKKYSVIEIRVSRPINSNADRRGHVPEILVMTKASSRPSLNG